MRYKIIYRIKGTESEAEYSAENRSEAISELQRENPEIRPDDIVSIRTVTENDWTTTGEGSSNRSRRISNEPGSENRAADSFDRLTDYSVTRNLLHIFLVVGWGIIGIGVFYGLYLILSGSILGFFSGGALVLLGFFVIFSVQITLAVINTADNSRKILELMHKVYANDQSANL